MLIFGAEILAPGVCCRRFGSGIGCGRFLCWYWENALFMPAFFSSDIILVLDATRKQAVILDAGVFFSLDWSFNISVSISIVLVYMIP